jgi:hypothetical protein
VTTAESILAPDMKDLVTDIGELHPSFRSRAISEQSSEHPSIVTRLPQETLPTTLLSNPVYNSDGELKDDPRQPRKKPGLRALNLIGETYQYVS